MFSLADIFIIFSSKAKEMGNVVIWKLWMLCKFLTANKMENNFRGFAQVMGGTSQLSPERKCGTNVFQNSGFY